MVYEAVVITQKRGRGKRGTLIEEERRHNGSTTERQKAIAISPIDWKPCKIKEG